MDGSLVGGDDELVVDDAEAVGFALDGGGPDGFSGFAGDDGDFAVESGDDLGGGGDEVEWERAFFFPEPAGGDGFFELADLLV